MSDNTHDLLKKQYEGPPTFEVWGEWGIRALLAELLGSDKLEPFNDGRPLHCQIMTQGFAKARQQRLPFQDVMHQLTWLLGWYLHIRQDEDRADEDRGNKDERWAMMDVMYEYPKLAAQDREGKSINEAFDSAGQADSLPRQGRGGGRHGQQRDRYRRNRHVDVWRYIQGSLVRRSVP